MTFDKSTDERAQRRACSALCTERVNGVGLADLLRQSPFFFGSELHVDLSSGPLERRTR